MEYAARPARKQNKIGSVKSANATIGLFVQRLLMDDEHQSRARGTKKRLYEILSRATFLKNVLYGGKQASSSELARGFCNAMRLSGRDRSLMVQQQQKQLPTAQGYGVPDSPFPL